MQQDFQSLDRHLAVWRALSAMLTGLLMVTLSVEAGTVPDLPPVRHPVPLERQTTPAWCWVAVARMLADYYHTQPPAQCDMLGDHYGHPCCTDPGPCLRAGRVHEIAQLLRTLTPLQPQSAGTTGLLPFYQALRRAPIVLHTRQGNGHFVIATGLRTVQTHTGRTALISINDPSLGRYELPFSVLQERWDGALLLR